MQHRSVRTTPGVELFAVFVFILIAVPKLNVKIGPVPFYVIDGLIALLLIQAQRLPSLPQGRRPFSGTVQVLFFLAVTSELLGGFRFGTLSESGYIIARTCLVFSVFFITGQLVRSAADVEVVLRAIVVGVIVTASLMILTSLPQTRAATIDFAFSHRFLEPASNKVVESYLGAGETGVRGRTLVGVSILGASFINICWPLAALAWLWPWRMSATWRNLAFIACLLAPMGVLMSYSRGPILGSFLIVVAAIVFGLRRVRRGIVWPIVVGTLLIATVGIGSQLFFFDRLVSRTQAIFDAPLADERESERILAYSEPFAHVVEKPLFLVVGEGITVRYTDVPFGVEQRGKATHAVFAMAYYAYGMTAAILYVLLLARAFAFLAAHAIARDNKVHTMMSQALFASLVGLLPWAAFGHAPVSTPRGAMLFFLLFGLISGLEHFRAPTYRPQQNPLESHVTRRHSAV